MSLIKQAQLRLIAFIHIIFVLFVIGVPFSNSNYLLMLHTLFVPFLILHWLINNDTCMVTVVEKALRRELYGGAVEDDCITCKIIEPVYNFAKNNYSKSNLIYMITIGLWIISSFRFSIKIYSGEISEFRELFQL